MRVIVLRRGGFEYRVYEKNGVIRFSMFNGVGYQPPSFSSIEEAIEVLEDILRRLRALTT